ncbi:MAG TPA: nitrilase-related carbon-nitrogen hydrolase [Terriglobales bacterium]|nr:nitrilase-related carbon-nitrogen hydrolase [Terriglobales bacterium]
MLAALLSGGMFYLSLGTHNVWPLVWFAPVPLLWLTYGRDPVWRVMLATLAAILAGSIYIWQCYSTVPLLILLQLILPQAVLFPLAIAFARLVHRRAPPLITVFAFPACWTLFEYCIGLLSPNGSFGSFAYTQVSSPVLIQSASLFGLYIITFLICLFSNAISVVLRPSRTAVIAAVTGLAICALNLGFGAIRLVHPQQARVRAAAFVDDGAMIKAWHAHSSDDLIAASRDYASTISRAADQGARFVVGAEGGLVSTAQLLPAVLAPIIATSKQTGAQIIVGVDETIPPGDLAFSVAPDGTVQRYSKRHLVPILESKFAPGHGSGWLGSGRAMEICKDMDFPRTIRRDAAKGVRLMGVPSGDFGRDAWIHGRMAIMRGVEDGFALVRAASSGIVTVSDAQGRIIASKMDSPAGPPMVVSDVPLGPGPTLYTKIGDLFDWTCVAFVFWVGCYWLCRGQK